MAFYRILFKVVFAAKSCSINSSNVFVSLFFCVSCFTIYADYANSSPSITLAVNTTTKPPVIDGVLDDYCWSQVYSYPLDEVKLKICYDNKYIYIAASFPAIIKSKTHKPWKWDIEKKAYLPGLEHESTLSLIWHAPNTRDLKDIWFWRSVRTNPTGFADDFYLVGPQNQSEPDLQIKIQSDSGTRCWYSKYFAQFAGFEIPRFYNNKPTGSCADIEAKGTWQKELWTVEFKRKLATGFDDDIDLAKLSEVDLQVFIGLPLFEYLSSGKNLIRLKFSTPEEK